LTQNSQMKIARARTINWEKSKFIYRNSRNFATVQDKRYINHIDLINSPVNHKLTIKSKYRSLDLTLTNSLVYELGDELCDKMFNSVISKYSYSSGKTKQPFVLDLEPNWLQVKSSITKNMVSRGLVLGHNPRDHRNSMHLSNKRIKNPTTRHSMPRDKYRKPSVHISSSTWRAKQQCGQIKKEKAEEDLPSL